ncbi:glycosyltransferase [Paracoccus marcusii]|uniref:glycosyltransferase n=1 Tax=Paracoccus marcusii TaxID=59779 RepID=UPI003267F699
MNVLFASGKGYPPEFSGGVQSSTHHLAMQLKRAGHHPSVLAALFGDGTFGLKARIKLKLLRRPGVIDNFPGYPVMRAWFPWKVAEFAVNQLRPDVAVVQCHGSVLIGKALQAQGVPLIVYLRNVEFHELGGDLRELRSALFIANSSFTAQTYKSKFGIDAVVIPPTIDAEQYRTTTTGNYVTLINPYPEKGFDLAVQIAQACPEIPFLFVESWKIDEAYRADIEKTIAPFPNIRFEKRTSDMKTVYGRTKILLSPSRWEEAWGRVASEAHCSGIPVIGSRRGGLPEAIGEGGIILDYDAPLEHWIAAVKNLWSDPVAYKSMAKAALDFSQRPQMQPDIQFSSFLELLEKARRID